MSVGARQLPELEQAARDMPFDQFGRYHMMREAIDACRMSLGKQSLSVLDVGGFYEDNGRPMLPLQRFLPADTVTVLDVVDCDLPGYVRGDGAALHFEDQDFDLVVSADTLEHIPQSRRAAFWHELVRVARHGVILLAPFHTPDVETAEAVLFEYIKVELQAEHQQLKEHRDYGLPVLDEWLVLLQSLGIAARAYPTGYLHAWLGMMLVKHMLLRMDAGETAQHLVDAYYNRSFFPTERRNPAYRHLIIAEKTLGIVEAVDAAIAPTLMPDQEDASRDWGSAFLPAMIAIVQRQLGALRQQQQEQTDEHRHQLNEREQIIANHRQHISNLESLSSEQREHIANFHVIVEQQHGHIDHYRQQVSFLDRVLADQQMLLARVQEQLTATHIQVQTYVQLPPQLAQATMQTQQYAAANQDLTERAAWLESQVNALRDQLAAVQHGRLMRLLNKLPTKR